MVKSVLALSVLLFSSAAIAAPESLNKVDTKNGEILLEVTAIGASSAKIIKVSTTCDMKVTAQSKSEAMAMLNKQQDDLANALRNAGLASAKLDFSAPEILTTDLYSPAAAAAGAAAAAAMEATDAGTVSTDDAAKPFVTYTRRVGISTSLATEMQVVRGLLPQYVCEEDYRAVRNTIIELANPEAAKTAASKLAVASAQKQAENYAAALNLRVVRLLRISEVSAIREFLGSESEALLREMRNDRDRQNSVTNELPVSASISADFVLGPK